MSKLRCDNGGEYTSLNMKNWCRNRGIIVDYTVPYTPQLNGKAERLNRSLMEKARCLIADSEMDKEMWGEAVRVAAYLLNRSPSSIIENTPYEMWNQRKPDLSTIHIFGCNAYAKVLGNLKKLDDRSKKYKMIGYAMNGYRFWAETEGKVSIHKDVVFDENIQKNRSLVHDIEAEKKEESVQEKKESEEIEQESKIEAVEHSTDIRKSSREKKIPARYENDYIVVFISCRYLNKYIYLNNIFKYIFNYCAMLTYEEAVNGHVREKWIEAIEEEKDSLNKNSTWEYKDKVSITTRYFVL